MKAKTIDYYFNAAKSQQLPMAYNEVAALVQTKGIINPHSKGFHFKTKWIMTTTTILAIGAALIFGLNQPNQNKNKSTVLPVVDTTHVFTIEKEKQNAFPKDEDNANAIENRKEIEKLETQNIEAIPKENKSQNLQLVALEVPKIEEVADELKFYEEPKVQINWKDSLEEAKEDFTPQKSYEKKIEANAGDVFQISNSRGGITLKNWDKPFVQVEALVEMKGDEEDIKLALDDFTLNVFKTGNLITVEDNSDKYCDCNCTGFSIPSKRKRRKTEDGEKFKVEGVTIRYMVSMPENMALDVKSNYGDVVLGNHNGNHKIYVFKGELFAENLQGESRITVKYGDAKIQNFQNGEFELFQSDLEVAAAKDVELNIKYGKANLQQINNLELYSFKGDVAIAQNLVSLNGNIKYGELDLKGNVTEIELDVFKAKVSAGNIETLNLEGSYTYVKAQNIKTANFDKSFQNEYRFGTVGNLKGSMQYTPIDIEKLTGGIDITSFKGSLDIDEVGGDFKEVKLDSKYTSIDLNFNETAKYDLDAEAVYGSLDVPSTSFNTLYENQVNQTKKLKGSYNTNSVKDAALVSINTFQSRVSLR